MCPFTVRMSPAGRLPPENVRSPPLSSVVNELVAESIAMAFATSGGKWKTMELIGEFPLLVKLSESVPQNWVAKVLGKSANHITAAENTRTGRRLAIPWLEDNTRFLLIYFREA